MPSPGIPRNRSRGDSLNSGGVFDDFKVDAPNAEGCALYIDFLELIEEKIRKSRNHLDVDDIVYREIGFHLFLSSFNDIEILVTLPNRKGCIWPQEFMAEDLG